MDEKRLQKYKVIGWTVIKVAFAICAIVFLFLRFSSIWEVIRKVLSVLNPFVIGFALAYLINPLYELTRKVLKKKGIKKKARKTIATIISTMAVLLIIYGLIALVLPKLMESLSSLVEKASQLVEGYDSWYERLEDRDFVFKEQALAILASVTEYIGEFSENILAQNLNVIASTVLTSVMSFAGVVYDFLIGVVAMVYLLNFKEMLFSGAKRMLYSLMPKQADVFCEKVKLFNRIFYSFLTGKLLDSLIIGMICFIGCELMQMPYALLVSVIVGITNIIPFFGPFIGAVPSAVIIFMVSPKMCLFFVIFVILLQQLDGNVIGPKILGNSTGVDSLSVLFSIIVGGGLFGFVGMLLAVPVWAFLKILIDEATDKKLAAAGLPTDIKAYSFGKHPTPKAEEETENEEPEPEENA